MLSIVSTVRPHLAAATLCLSAMIGAAPVLASGGHSSDDSAPSKPAAQTPSAQQAAPDGDDDMTTCARHRMWDTKRKRCVRMRSEALPDGAVADYAYALAKAKRYEEALAVLDLMRDGNTAEAWNYRGYATRKLGRIDEGIGYYRRAIALDPAYPKVREYLGEAYVIKGRIDLAEQQLGTIGTLCGTGCEPYRDLSAAIKGASSL